MRKRPNLFFIMVSLTGAALLYGASTLETAERHAEGSAENLEDLISTWEGPEDVRAWFELNFRYDRERERLARKHKIYPQPLEATFMKKSGICIDAAYFACRVLRRIRPELEARGLKMLYAVKQGKIDSHVVCEYKENGAFYILDQKYILGPYRSIEDYYSDAERLIGVPIKGHTYLRPFR